VTREEYADRLAAVAAELAVRVRDDDPEANSRWLAAVLPTYQERFDLLFVLAAAVPDDRSWTALTAWTVQNRVEEQGLQPHGTHAAAQRHRYHGEPLCDPCRDAERARDRERKRTAYWAAKGQPATTTEETRAA
jgi:hypothetical protein